MKHQRQQPFAGVAVLEAGEVEEIGTGAEDEGVDVVPAERVGSAAKAFA